MRRAALILGLVLLGASAWSAFGLFGEAGFTGHMIVHMAIVVVVAPLMALGLAGSRLDVTQDKAWLAPLPMSLVELVTVWFWHAPAIRAAADRSAVVGVIEIVTFLVAGLLLWLASIGASRTGSLEKRLSGVVALLLTSMHMTLLGVLLTMAPRPLYGAGPATCFGIVLSPEQDQQVGGVVMLLLGAVAYLVGGLALFGSVMRGRPQTEAMR